MTILSTPPEPTAHETEDQALTATGTRSRLPLRPSASSTSLSTVPSWVGGVIGAVIIVGVWWLASQTLYTATHAIPTPWAVAKHFLSGSDWTSLKNNFLPTISSASWGFLWGDLAAIVLAFLVLLIPPLEEIANQIAIVTYCLPPVAIGPIVVIIAGQDHPQGAPVVLASLAPFFTTVVGCLIGLRSSPQASLDVITAYGGSSLTQLRKVRVIAALPNLFAGLKIAAPAAFLGAVLAEFLGGGGDNSVGQALIAAQTQADAPRLWYLALASGAAAGIGYVIVGAMARLVTRWAAGTGGSTQ